LSPRFDNLPVENRLRALARAWLGELRREGLSGGRKTEHEIDYPLGYREGSLTRPVRLATGEMIWLRLAAYRDERGFLRTQVLETPPRTDRAIFAALSVLEAGEGDPEKVRDALTPKWDKKLKKWVYGRLGGPEERLLVYADNLLLHHRPTFRELPEADQRELRVKACEHIVAVAREAERLHRFLEYGKPVGRTRKAIKNAQRSVLAAEMHHIEGMSQREVAAELGLPVSDRNKRKGGHDTAETIINQGEDLFLRALGEQGWEQYKQLRHEEHEEGGGSPTVPDS